ncbi:MAG: hypothetical protein IJE97_10535, partial [Thermoguttaceae bacterium]|nr:hypothetical protein [Thermoguttaceae bacterium]
MGVFPVKRLRSRRKSVILGTLERDGRRSRFFPRTKGRPMKTTLRRAAFALGTLALVSLIVPP